MPNIFISYRRDDAGYVAGMLSDRLQKEFGPNTVFIDVDTIPLGVDFRQRISDAVAKCDVFLAIIGDNWLTHGADNSRRIDDPADFVRIEIESAIARNIPVVPILIGSAKMPSPDVLPDSLSPLAFRNAAELRAGRDMNHHVDLLVRGLRSHLPPVEDASEQPKKPMSPLEKIGAAAKAAAGGLEAPTAKLHFVRDTWFGMVVSFQIWVDEKRVGELPPGYGNTLDVSVSPGKHHLRVTASGAFYDGEKQISADVGQTHSWKVGYTLTGGVRLSEL